MFQFPVLVFSILILGHLKQIGAQITCYQCNSYRDGLYGRYCIDPVDLTYINSTTCPSGYVCSKVSYLAQKTFITSRSCDYDSGTTCNDIQKTLQRSYPDLSQFKCNTCRRNYCNSGAPLRMSLVAIAIGALLATIF